MIRCTRLQGLPGWSAPRAGDKGYNGGRVWLRNVGSEITVIGVIRAVAEPRVLTVNYRSTLTLPPRPEDSAQDLIKGYVSDWREHNLRSNLSSTRLDFIPTIPFLTAFVPLLSSSSPPPPPPPVPASPSLFTLSRVACLVGSWSRIILLNARRRPVNPTEKRTLPPHRFFSFLLNLPFTPTVIPLGRVFAARWAFIPELTSSITLVGFLYDVACVLEITVLMCRDVNPCPRSFLLSTRPNPALWNFILSGLPTSLRSFLRSNRGNRETSQIRRWGRAVAAVGIS